MQEALDLSDAEIGLVTSVYLLPGVLLAVPVGILADRLGRRLVLSVSLLMFGVGAIVALAEPESFALLLAVRVVQGAAFAGVLSVTITIIGDRFDGPLQVTAQGLRSLALKIGDAALPVIGGALATVAWYAPIATQLLALPVGIAAWFVLEDGVHPGTIQAGRIGRAISLAKNLPVSTLLTAGFFRFFFKFAYLTYVPVLAVGSGAMSVWEVGALLGVAALSAAISGPFAGKVTSVVRPSTAVGLAVSSIGLSFLALSAESTSLVLWISAVVFGVSDGLFGVVQTALTTQIPGSDIRATFVGLAATLRNLGKFAAPTVVGGLVLWLSVARSFAVVGVIALASVGMIWPLRSLEADSASTLGGSG
jgi:MFS family permease